MTDKAPKNWRHAGRILAGFALAIGALALSYDYVAGSDRTDAVLAIVGVGVFLAVVIGIATVATSR